MTTLVHRRSGQLLATLVAAVVFTLSTHGVRAAEPPAFSEATGFGEIGQISIPQDPESFPDGSGWLVLNPHSRRGYILVESAVSTKIQSFDLDTLERRSTAVVPGVPVMAGQQECYAGVYSGEVVHAIDPVAERVYFAFSNGQCTHGNGGLVSAAALDVRRMADRFVVLDEKQFDRDPSSAFGGFQVPPLQTRLVQYPLLGLRVSREHVQTDKPGKLLALFASAALVAPNSPHGVYDHTLTQWDVSGVVANRSPEQATYPPLDTNDWEHLPTACASTSITSSGGNGATTVGLKNYQWGILPSKDAIFFGCQTAQLSGAVVRIGLDGRGHPRRDEVEQIVPLGKPITDSMVDPAGKRVYLKSFGVDGVTWWAFDTGSMRFAGSIATGLKNGQLTAAGIDESSGRLYTSTSDQCVDRNGGGQLPVRGGLKFVDARLDPVPAAQNARPDLAYPTVFRIQIDPVARRVYLRRGNRVGQSRLVYPGCEDRAEPSPIEYFYRVLADTVPVAEAPGAIDDAAFTTNVPEKEGLTQASFLGSGSGFGSRVILTGGIDALTRGGVSAFERGAQDYMGQRGCGRDDRELLAGSVGMVEVSNQSTRAEAASLDADGKTIEVLGSPLNRCRPLVIGQEEGLNKCPAEVKDLAFDDVVKDSNGAEVDGNKDGCPDRTGENKYKASCIEDQDPPAVNGPSSSRLPRHGFTADVVCAAAAEKAKAHAEGSLASEQVDALQASLTDAQVAGPVRVGRSSSTVRIRRRLGEGIKVSVEALARGIDLPGGSIGAVRTEAVSIATGRDGKAEGTFHRTICDVQVRDVIVSGCIGDERQQASLVKKLNEALNGRGEFRLRAPDQTLREGTPHGYLAGTQRDRKELFADQTITRDRSLAIPGLELVLFVGDGGEWGAGRQVFQFAGVQAATSYGIVCSYGQAVNGKCAEEGGDVIEDPPIDDEDVPVGTSSEPIVDGEESSDRGQKESGIRSVIRRIPQAIAEALRLLFNNPRELALLATVWGLLYAPCYLGERRRSIRGVQARRATVGGV